MLAGVEDVNEVVCFMAGFEAPLPFFPNIFANWASLYRHMAKFAADVAANFDVPA